MRGLRRWWQAAEDPWQTLAACMEVRNALAWGDVAAFPSRLPVQVDGSCNGLQHYAALSRDARGAAAVNLTPVSRPQVGPPRLLRCRAVLLCQGLLPRARNFAVQDTYSEVAEVVKGIVAADAAKGVAYARALHGAVDRKLVKQTVMTSVYGVTSRGARNQIASRLSERGWRLGKELDKIAHYAATVMF